MKKKKDIIEEWVKKEQNKHPKCSCGCGEEIIILFQHYYNGIPKFKKGHSSYHPPLTYPKEHLLIVESFEDGYSIQDIIKKFGYSIKIINRVLYKEIGKEKTLEIIKERQKERSKKLHDNHLITLSSEISIDLKNDFETNKISFNELIKKYKISAIPLRRILIGLVEKEKYNSIIREQRKEIFKKNKEQYWEKWKKKKAELLWNLEDDFDWNLIYENLDKFEEIELSDNSILIDSNERNEYIINHLDGIKKRLWICDYYIYGNPHVLIERKTISDLYQSLNDGRLWNQLKTMQIFPTYPTVIFPAILVEGEYNQCNWRIKKRFKEWQFENLLNVIRFKWQTAVIRSRDAKDTVSILKAIRYTIKPKKETGKKYYITPIKKKNKSLTELRIANLMTIEGIGENTAIKLLQKYKTIEDIMIESKTSDDKIMKNIRTIYCGL